MRQDQIMQSVQLCICVCWLSLFMLMCHGVHCRHCIRAGGSSGSAEPPFVQRHQPEGAHDDGQEVRVHTY